MPDDFLPKLKHSALQRSRSAEFDFPAERAFPLSVVIIHGVLAVTTVTVVVLAMLGVGGG